MTPNDKNLRYTVGRMTVIGERENQEDNYCVMSSQLQHSPLPIDAIFAVADGMGGHTAGEVASRIVIETLDELSSRTSRFAQFQNAPLSQTVESVIQEMNHQIYQNNTDMGTTITAGFLSGDLLLIGHVGDSRAYLIRGQSIKQLTEDHSLVAEKIDQGIISERQAKDDPHRSVILRSLGQDASVEVDLEQFIIEPDDILVFCSDGLTDRLDDMEIRNVAVSHDDPQVACQKLVSLAQRKGPRHPDEQMDNTTVIIVKFSGTSNRVGTVKLDATEASYENISKWRKIWLPLLAGLVTLAVILIFIVVRMKLQESAEPQEKPASVGYYKPDKPAEVGYDKLALVSYDDPVK
jgi:PPM family protein phosphatase